MTLKGGLKRIIQGPFRRVMLCYFAKPEWLQIHFLQNALICGLELEQLTPEASKAVGAFRDKNVIEAFRQMSVVQRALLARWQGEPCGHAVLKHPGNLCHLAEYWQDKYYIHYCYVAESMRGMNIYPSMLVKLATDVFAVEQSAKVYISADENNRASLRGIEKAGFRQYAKLYEYGWGGVVLWRRVVIARSKEF